MRGRGEAALERAPIEAGSPGVVSLPQGAGKVQGMGESFAALLSTGVATYHVPFALLAARGGFQPSLTLGYSSSAGDGVAGMGWNTGVPFIARQADRGTPRYFDPAGGGGWHPNQDRFVYDGAELVPICLVQAGACAGALANEAMPSWANGWQYFRPHVEGAFQRIFWSPDHKTWRVQDKSGTSLEFGVPLDGTGDTNALEVDPLDASHVFRWNLARAYDVDGASNQAGEMNPRPANVAVYRYRHDGGIAYPSDVYDTPPLGAVAPAPLDAYAHHVRLEWQGRADRLTTYRRGWAVTQQLRLARVDVTGKPAAVGAEAARRLVRRYHLGYEAGYHVSLLASVQVEGRCAELEDDAPAEGAGGLLPVTACERLPPLTFGYSHVPGAAGNPAPAGFEPIDKTLRAMASSPPEGLGAFGAELVDVNADGLVDTLVTAPSQFGGDHGVYYNGGGGVLGGFGAPAHVAVEAFDDPAVFVGPHDLTLLKPFVAPLDLDGDGRTDLVHMPPGEPPVVFSALVGQAGRVWRGRVSAAKALLHPDVDLVGAGNEARIADVDGDGLVDVVVSHGDALETFLSLGRYPGGDGRLGHANWTGASSAALSIDPVGACVPNEGGSVHFSDPTIKLADMNGDGLVDIVRVQNGDIYYWPGRGTGVWGTGDPATCLPGGAGTNRHVDMTASPQLFGAPDGVTLQDVNGDGLADAVMIYSSSVSVWLNVNGTAWGPEVIIGGTPNGNDRNALRVADVDGTGTADIVWGHPSSFSYIDLTAGKRPWLLTSVNNGLGQSTELTYTTSTGEMVDAAARGEAWSSTAPAVAHVLKRVAVRDNLGAAGLPDGIYVTEYNYRDAVYDGRERKFRGFRSATETKLGDANGPASTTRTEFLLGECADEGAPGRCAVANRHRDNPREALAGRPTLVESYDSAGVYLGTTHTGYRLRRLYVGLDGREVRQAFASDVDEFVYDNAPFVAGRRQVSFSDVTYELSPGVVAADPARTITLHSGQGLARRHAAARVDAFGNPVDSTADGCVSGCASVDESIVTTARFERPAGDKSGWLWRSAEQHVRGSKRPAELRNHLLFDYDSFGRLWHRRADLKGTLPLARSPATGGAVAPAPPGASQDGERILETLTYHDVGGRLRRRVGPNGQCADATYEPTYARFPETQTTYVGAVGAAGCGERALVSSAEHDAGLQAPVATRGPNGELSRAEYDQHGRVTRLWQPDPADPTVVAPLPSTAVAYLLPDAAGAPGAKPYSRVHTQTLAGANEADPSYRHSWTYVDGLGRTLAVLDEADPSAGDGGAWRVSGLVRYTAKGAPERAYQPFFWTGPPDTYPLGQAPTVPFLRQRYDAFGRVVESFHLDGATAGRTDYHALSQDTWDAEDLLPGGAHEGTYASARADGHGRTVATAVRERVNGAIEVHEVRTEYLPTGEPLRVERANVGKADSPVVRWLRYDTLGRRVLNVEPHTSVGFTADPNANPAAIKAFRYAYDDSGRLVGTSDARGCGANYHYDAAGRLVAEDLSPCEAGQAPYTAPNLTTGDGAEAFYRYDVADPDAASAAAAGCAAGAGPPLGKITSVSSRAEKSLAGYDGRGRPVCHAKRVAKPGLPSASLAARYAPRWYVTETSFDGADRVARATTGATSGELLGAGGESAIAFGYAKNGSLFTVDSSYGPLVESSEYDADGLPTVRVYGDMAATSTRYEYDARRRIGLVETLRQAPSIWTNPPSGYAPPADRSTLQTLLQRDRFTYDEVGNPIAIADERTAAEWSPGSKPVSRSFVYDDLYRLRSMALSYGGGVDSWRSPFEAENQGQIGEDAPKPSPHVAFGSRPQQQTFTYDWLGSMVSSGDDASGFYDRSLGTVTNDHAQRKPYQLTKASNRALAGDATRRGDLDAAYDATGNLVAMVVRRDGPCLPAGASCWQRFAYAWDEVGLLASAKRWDLTPAERSAHGSLASPTPARSPDAELRHAYGAGGERARKTSIDTTGAARHTLYVFASLELRSTLFRDAAGDYERNGTVEQPYLLANGVRLGRVVPGEGLPSLGQGAPPHVFLTLSDHLGSAVAVIDRTTSELAEQDGYQAYGGADNALRPGRWQSQREAYRFTGKEDDIEVGLQYFGARYYAPLLGRWVSADPLAVHELGADPNLYAYVHGRALMAVDPDGQNPVLIGILIGVGVSLAVNTVMQGIAVSNDSRVTWSWGSFAAAGFAGAVGGAVGGGVASAAGSTLLGAMEAGAAGSWVGGMAGRSMGAALEGRSGREVAQSMLDPQAMAFDIAIGGATGGAAFGVAKGTDAVYRSLTADTGSRAVAGGSPSGPGGSTAPGGAGPGPVADDVTAARAAAGYGCFVAGTVVPTVEGLRPIETLRAGDLVLTRDPSTGELSYQPVLRTFTYDERPLVELEVDTPGAMMTIETTPGHPFFVQNRGWIGASDLAAGDRLSLASGEWVAVLQVTPKGVTATVHNVEVYGTHTYFVGHARVWVHNQSRSGLPAVATATPEAAAATQRPQPTFLNRADPASGRIVGTLTKVGESEYRIAGVKELTGRYDFVVRDGQVVLGRGHYTLAGGGKPVTYAGDVSFDRGRIVDWTNASGHYRPGAAFAGNAGLPLELFRAANFPVMVGLPQIPLYRP